MAAPMLVSPYATLSFPHLFQPQAFEGQEAKFKCSLIFDETAQQTKEWKAMQKAVADLMAEKFPKLKASQLRLPFRDAGEKADQYDGYDEGKIFLNVTSKKKPGIVDARNQDVLVPDDVFPGQLVRAQLQPYAYDQAGNKGISFGLINLQIVKKDAPRIDGRVAASKAFDVIDEDEMDEVPF